MPRRKAADPLLEANNACMVASAFLMLADDAKKLGEKDIAVMALKRVRCILRRRLIEGDENDV